VIEDCKRDDAASHEDVRPLGFDSRDFATCRKIHGRQTLHDILERRAVHFSSV
jgi:hypothetical protein